MAIFIINLTLFNHDIYFVYLFFIGVSIQSCCRYMRQRASELWSGPLPVSDPRTPIPSPRRIGIAVAVELGQLPSSGAHKKLRARLSLFFCFSLAVLRLICKFPIMKQHKHVCVWQPQKRGLREEGRGTLSPCGVSCVAPLFRPLYPPKNGKSQDNKRTN